MDIIDRRAPRGWAKALRLLVGRAQAAEVAQAAVSACAKAVRDNGGIPRSEDFEEALQRRTINDFDSESALTRIDAIAHACGHTLHAKLGATAAKRLVIDIARRGAAAGPIRQRLCEEFLLELCNWAVFGRVGPELGKHYNGPEAARRRSNACREVLWEPLRALAAQLAANPGGRSIRASRRRLVPRMGTDEILAQPIM